MNGEYKRIQFNNKYQLFIMNKQMVLILARPCRGERRSYVSSSVWLSIICLNKEV